MLDPTLWHRPAIAFLISLRGLAACKRGDHLATAQPSAAASTKASSFVSGFPGRHLSGDDRVESEPVSVELEVPLPADAKAPTQLTWWVTYQRVATIGNGTNPADATIESEVKLHAGSLAWTTTPTAVKQP